MKTVICCFISAALIVTAVAIACAPEFPRAVFSYAHHPDFPRTDYLAGRLGVIQPSYARSYLVIAYRYLNGPALTAAERQQVRDYWKDRETAWWDKTETDWVAKWQAARMRVPGAKPPRENTVTQGRYKFDHASSSFYPDCADDAYKTAFETLQARVKKFGIGSAAVRSWRDAQDTVFSNCDDDHAAIPPAASSDLPPVIQADRDYQIAAANFYAGHYAEAEARFRRIAADPATPWSRIAPYLVVRTMSRNEDLSHETIEAEARAVLAKPSLSALHGMTRVLLHRMVLQGHAEEYFHQLARDLASGRQGGSVREELWDYTTDFDNYVDYSPWERWEPKKKVVDSSVFSRDELSDWIFTFQQQDSRAPAHALERWRQRRSLPWLIAALRFSTSGHPENDELLAAAARLDPSSPGYEIANFHRLRLMVDAGHKEDARVELDRLLASPLTKSGINLFRALRMRAAPELTDFLKFAARAPVMLTIDWNVGEVPPIPDQQVWERKLLGQAGGRVLLDRDSIKILNERTPMHLIREAASGESVAPSAEHDFVLSAFTRALLLDDTEDGLPLAKKLVEIGADKQNLLSIYQAAKDTGDRRFAGVFYLLHHAESRPYFSSGLGRIAHGERLDEYRDNWWCPVDVAVELDARTNWSEYGGLLAPRRSPDSPEWSAAFLTQADRETAAKENAQLAATGSGPDYLIAETMRYARAHLDDPRVPEALHDALRAQRFGCVQAKTAAAAEQAWKYLWRHYPKNAWTRKTNYSFESENLPRPAAR